MDLEPSIREWVESVALPGARIRHARVLEGGYSNHNVVLGMSDGGRFVLRRYLRRSSCAVEVALARRLAGTVPVPAVVAADETGVIAGEPVLLSTYVEGRPGGEAREVGLALARIGSVEFERPGFFGDGWLEPGPPGMEPVSGLARFVEQCLERGNADGHLTAGEQRALRKHAEEAEPELEVLRGSRRLVHGDFNPKNLLSAGNAVVAVLDWEFAFSGSPLFDVGNMLRDPRPGGFEERFIGGFRDGGGELPGNWRRLSRALDLYSLADLLTRPVGHRYFSRAVKNIREIVA
ncbi:phosphotransferase family protein [Dactylosporangium sp. CA-233914]|uniref:phosphotransferase family protein n=1 Tax=Dactylosporangium sp. CA-233914 TaxID=3239934 RepID=UPI003D8C94EA